MEPLELFLSWYREAQQIGELQPDAMALATSTSDATPSVRMLLFKGIEKDRVLFFTNYESEKANELDSNPKAAIVFFWPKLERQVRFRGGIARATDSESDRYWKTRPRESQLGAWASRQSSVIESRDDLENKLKEIRQKFEGKEIPRPKFWGGYALSPNRVEFWQGRAHRLHERERYVLQGSIWRHEILSP